MMTTTPGEKAMLSYLRGDFLYAESKVKQRVTQGPVEKKMKGRISIGGPVGDVKWGGIIHFISWLKNLSLKYSYI